MRYEKLVQDFADRTRDNLAAIEGLVETQRQKEKKPTVFEITQLINSCLGLIVMPREKDIKKIPRTSLGELETQGWPIPRLTNSSERPHNLNLRHLIEYLRNAIAHFNIEFTHNDHNEITGLKIWNQKERGDCPRKWESTLSVCDLRDFVEKFSQVIVQNLEK